MLTVEQCAVLRELGYPQDKAEKRHGIVVHRIVTGLENYLAIPSLDELIMWLGEDFSCLLYAGRQEGYMAEGWHQNQEKDGHGATPLEAVYNLAVAMRGKGDQ